MTLPRTQTTFAPPVMEAHRWRMNATFPENRPLINVSQAAPVDPPHPGLRRAIADAALNDDDAHLYGPVLGMPALRSALANRTAQIYGAAVDAAHVAITSGCNQAFAAAIAALCAEGDEVIVPTPWYFNHKMWLDMSGVQTVALQTDDTLLPDPALAKTLITPRTRAIALVSPNNPTGLEYPPALLRAFFDLARAHGIALIVDETYRDFHSQNGAPHDLFADTDWDNTLIHLYSFSKSYRLTGHRVGALITSPARLAEIEKFLDTVAICPAQLGQHAALWGIENLGDWLAGERQEILRRRAAITSGFDVLAAQGWRLLGAGAYFAYLEHPFDAPSDKIAQQLVETQSILCLPGTMFTPQGDATGKRQLRIAFANLDATGIAEFFKDERVRLGFEMYDQFRQMRQLNLQNEMDSIDIQRNKEIQNAKNTIKDKDKQEKVTVKVEKKTSKSSLSFNEKREFGALEADIERLQKKKLTIENQFLNVEIAPDDIQEKSIELQQIITDLEEKISEEFDKDISSKDL